MALTAVVEQRIVPAGESITMKLRGARVSPSPIQGIVSCIDSPDTFVDADVDWTPFADGKYVVRGVLAVTGSSIWIVEALTGLKVTAVVTGQAALQGPVPTFEVPEIKVLFECGKCEVRPDAVFRIADAYKRLAVKTGAQVDPNAAVEIGVVSFNVRPEIDRLFLAIGMKNDVIRARVMSPKGAFIVEDFYLNKYLGADSLAGRIGELIFKELAKKVE